MTAADAQTIREALSGDLAELHRGQENMARQVREILVALTGNGLGVSHGLIGCVQKLEASAEEQACKITAIENRWDRIKWTVAGIAVGSGLGGGGIAVGILRAFGG